MARKKYNGGSGFFIIDLHVYPFEVMVSVDEPFDVLARRVRRYGVPDADLEILRLGTKTRGKAVMFENNATVIVLKSNPDKAALLGIIVHESFHATNFILDRIGCKLEIGVSDEAFSYLIGYLCGEIVERMKILKQT